MAEGGAHSYDTLSDQLHVSTALLEHMLQDLAQMGYIAPVGGACDTSQCRHCPLGSSCATDSRGNVWVMTEKGIQAKEEK
jgi:hypothetical protein